MLHFCQELEGGEQVEDSQIEASLREVFSLFDEGGDGAVSEHDMQHAFDLLQVELISRDLKALFAGRGDKARAISPSSIRTACAFLTTLSCGQP